MTPRLALAVGDTAGHVMPALAVAQAYRRLRDTPEIHFFSAGAGTGHWLIEQAGFPLHYVAGAPLARVGLARRALALWLAFRGVAEARALLKRHRIQLVLGTGGFGSAGPVVAGRLLGLPTALIEPNAVPGLANRLLGRIVERAYVSFADTAACFPRDVAVVTGMPTAALGAATPGARSAPNGRSVRLLFTSGSRGTDFMATRGPALCEALRSLGLDVEVRHQGGADTADVQAAYDSAGVRAEVVPFINDMPAALAWADMVVSRAGAGTIAELGLARVPAILVPLADAAHDHQSSNAAALVRAGAALSVGEHEWNTATVAAQIAAVVSEASRWQHMSEAMATLGAPAAAETIVRDCDRLMATRR